MTSFINFVVGSDNGTQQVLCKLPVSLQRVQSSVRPKSLPLDWLFGTKSHSLADRILARLIQAEAHEANPHYRDDYRQTFIALSLALAGNPIPFIEASYQMYGLHPDKVYPAILARRKALLGSEIAQMEEKCHCQSSYSSQKNLTTTAADGSMQTLTKLPLSKMTENFTSSETTNSSSAFESEKLSKKPSTSPDAKSAKPPKKSPNSVSEEAKEVA